MKVWGIGFNFAGKSENDKSNIFINNGFVCLGWSKEQKPDFYELLESVEIGDLVYLKKWSPQDDELEIKGVGIVRERNYSIDNGFDNEIVKKTGLRITWIKDLSDNSKKFIPCDDNWRKGINRYNSIYEETHSEIKEYVIDLLDCNIKK